MLSFEKDKKMGLLGDMAKNMIEDEEGKGVLSEQDHEDMDKLLGEILDAYRNGVVDRETAIGDLADVIAGIDTRDLNLFRHWVTTSYPEPKDE